MQALQEDSFLIKKKHFPPQRNRLSSIKILLPETDSHNETTRFAWRFIY